MYGNKCHSLFLLSSSFVCQKGTLYFHMRDKGARINGEKEQTNISKKKIANIHKENYSTSEQVLPCKWSENKSIEWDFQSDNWEGLKWNVFICTFICSEMVKLGALLHTWKISKPTQLLGVCLMKKPQFSVLVTERIPLHSFIRVHMECDAKNEASKRPLSL